MLEGTISPRAIPPIKRAIYRSSRDADTANIKSEITVRNRPAIISFLRPNRSESCPPIGENRNWAAPKAATR
ncbi:hypothetical protein D3C87_2038680 [compost metagenome]